MILLDLVAPLTAFSMMQADIRLIARTQLPVVPDVGLPIAPTDSFATAPAEKAISAEAEQQAKTAPRG